MTSIAQRFAMAAAVGLGLMAPMQQVSANSDYETYRHLSAQWWQWALSIPPSENPLADATGEKCMVGQHGSVWFLAGVFNSGEPTVRTCTVPKGKALFFPIVNSVNVDTPNICGQGSAHASVDDLRAGAAAFIDGATKLSAEVDGKPIRNLRRVKSNVFAVALPEDNLFDKPCMDAFGADLGNVPAGAFAPAVDDGYYLKLKPLKAGTHTVRFHAENPSASFVLDVTYNLTVVPGTADPDDEEDD